MSTEITNLNGEGSKVVYWNYPRIGTCGEPMDTMRLVVSRTRAIPDLIIGFDGERDGWVLSADILEGDEVVTKEVAFIPESKML